MLARRTMPYITFLATLTVTAFEVSAAEIPRYDVAGYCGNVAEISGGSDLIYNGCIKNEQVAYNTLKERWESIPARTRAYCLEVGRVSGGSYLILDGCFDLELSAANNKSTFEY